MNTSFLFVLLSLLTMVALAAPLPFGRNVWVSTFEDYTDCQVSGDNCVMNVNGIAGNSIELNAKQTYTFTIRASGVAYQGVYPRVALYIDSARLRTFDITSPDIRPYSYTYTMINGGTRTVSLRYINDEGGRYVTLRSLKVDLVATAPTTPPTEPPPVVVPEPPAPPPTTGTPAPRSLNVSRLEHKAIVTLSGSGFGTRVVPVSDLTFDDASGNSINDLWDFAYPNSNSVGFQMGYYAPSQVTRANGGRGVALPHSRISRYLAGAHYNSGPTGTHNGWNVCVGKNRQQRFGKTYITYYRAVDPNWNSTNSDHNFKEYDYALGNGYMGSGRNYYFNIESSVSALVTTNVRWASNYAEGNARVLGINSTSIMEFYPNTGGTFSLVTVPGPAQRWHRVELVLHHSSNGRQQIYQDNKLVWDVNVNDSAISAAGGDVSETVAGGYVREAGSSEAFKNNWRYYADVYYDHSFSRVVLANNADYSKATITEPQVLTSWSSSQISFQTNLGRLSANSTAYLFVVNENGQRSTAGIPVNVGN